MFCPKCGKEIKDDSVFCVYCGSKVNNITNTAETKEENEEILCYQIKEECIQENIIKKNSKKKVLLGGGIASVAVIACVGGAVFMTSFSGNSEKGAPVAESSDITNTSKEREAKAITQETEEMTLKKEVQSLNEGNSIEKISLYEENYKVGKRDTSKVWNEKLFYTLEDVNEKSSADGKINSYNIEKKQLMNKDTNNLIEYEVYRNPETNALNKIVSIEYKDTILEITDYYYTDEGKVNFIFKREDVNYVPTYATPDKSGERYYYEDDTLTKWRIVNNGIQTNYMIGKKEEERGNNVGTNILYKELSQERKKAYDETERKMLNAAYNTYHVVQNAKGISRIVGYIYDQNARPIDGADVHLYSNDYEEELYTVMSDQNGKYSITIPTDKREYRLEVTKEGYTQTVLYNIEQNMQLIGIYQESIYLLKTNQEAIYNIQLVISDAFNRADNYDSDYGMKRLDYANLNLRRGINNRTGDVYRNVMADEEGIAYLQLEPGMYTVEVIKTGYETTFYTISVLRDGMVIQVNTTPILNDDEVRIILTWDQNPEDLDSHLFTPYDSSSEDTTYHIYYSNKSDANLNNLDVDDIDGYGPETMTINHLGNGLYKYYVVDYTNSSNGNPTSYDMSYSNATVDIYTSAGLIQTFHVPMNRSGAVWEVFEIRNRRIVPLQRYYNTLDKENTWWEHNEYEEIYDEEEIIEDYETDSSTWNMKDDIQYIRDVYAYTNNHIKSYEKFDATSEITDYVFDDSTLIKAVIKNDLDLEDIFDGDVAVEYYYGNPDYSGVNEDKNNLIFAFVTVDKKEEYRYYFKEGKIIRYIGPDHVEHDFEGGESIYDNGGLGVSEVFAKGMLEVEHCFV